MRRFLIALVMSVWAVPVSAQTHPCDQPDQTVATKGTRLGFCVPAEDLQAGWRLLINGAQVTDWGILAPLGTPSATGQYYLEAPLPSSGYPKGIYSVQVVGYAPEGIGPASDTKLWQVGGPPVKPSKPRVAG